MSNHEAVVDLMNDRERLKQERDALVKALSDLLDANKRLASLSMFHSQRNVAIAGQEVAERAARGLLTDLIAPRD